MNFELSEEEKSARETFASFCDKVVMPRAQEIDEAGRYPRELIGKLAELDFFGLRYPESVGGCGMGLLAYCLAVEEIARGSLSLAACAAMQSLMATHFLHSLGDEEIHERLLKPALRAEKIGAFCITEPNAGSDLSAISTSAEKVKGGYELTGQKMWVTVATEADFFTVFARTGKAKKLTMFLAEKGSKGLAVGKAIEKMGCWACPTAELSFDRCFVPDNRRLGEEGEGEGELRKILSEIRIMTGALALGVARAALHDSLKYASEREQFGKPINRFQAIQLKFGEMGTKLEAATHLIHYAAWLKDNGKPHQREAAMAKLFATESAVSICDEATRILASYGYAMEFPVQRYFRDIRFTLYGGGTSEILKLLIAKEMSA